MPEIREIQIGNLNVPQIPDWLMNPPQSVPPVVPVTVYMGTPIVNLPGCVESHPDAGKSKTLAEDDPQGVKTYCDAQTPSFNPIEYNPEEMTVTTTTPPPKTKTPEPPETPATPGIPETPAAAANVECPTEAQLLKKPVGSLTDDGKERITEYRLIGQECIPVKEKVSLPTQIIESIPSAGMITTTASIAVVATSSALLAKPLTDLLLKVIKPTIKKVMKKITTLRGKTVKIESLKERRDQQRIRNKAVRVLKGRG